MPAPSANQVSSQLQLYNDQACRAVKDATVTEFLAKTLPEIVSRHLTKKTEADQCVAENILQAT
jgi:hypothetical protein